MDGGSLYGMASVVLAMTFCQFQPPTMMDASTIAAVGDRYGGIRLWGSIGFGLMTLVAGGLAWLSKRLSGSSLVGFSAAFSLSSFLYLLSVIGFSKLNVKALWDKGRSKKAQPSTL